MGGGPGAGRGIGFAARATGVDAGVPEVLKMIDIVLRRSARDVVHADLASCGWAGSDLHLTGVARQLERARTGEVDYLAVVTAPDVPVAAALAVEENNPRARALYEQLGYVAYDRRPDSWDEQAEDGSLRRHETMCTVMRKELA